MEKGIIITLGLIIGYLLFRFIYKKQKNAINAYSDISELQGNSEYAQKSKNSKEFLGHENPLDFHMSKKQGFFEHTQKSPISDESTISDILSKDKYKVKGQWDK